MRISNYVQSKTRIRLGTYNILLVSAAVLHKVSPDNTGDDIRYQYDERYFKLSKLRSKRPTDTQHITELQYMLITKLLPVIQKRNYSNSL